MRGWERRDDELLNLGRRSQVHLIEKTKVRLG